jgi:hypothetical protein
MKHQILEIKKNCEFHLFNVIVIRVHFFVIDNNYNFTFIFWKFITSFNNKGVCHTMAFAIYIKKS